MYQPDEAIKTATQTSAGPVFAADVSGLSGVML
jgi:hypothetical protein